LSFARIWHANIASKVLIVQVKLDLCEAGMLCMTKQSMHACRY